MWAGTIVRAWGWRLVVRARRFKSSPDLSEAKRATFLLSCGTVRLLHQVDAAGDRGSLLRVDRLKCRKFSDGSPVAGQLVRADRFGNVEFSEQSDQKRSRRFSIRVALQDTEHDSVFVPGPPQPVTETTDGGTHLILSANSER